MTRSGRNIFVGAILTFCLLSFFGVFLRVDERTQLEAAENSSAWIPSKELIEQFPGRIVFDSNRSQTFGIYSIRVDGTDVQTIVDTELHETTPDPSPDGKWIVYASSRSTKRYAPRSVWIVKSDGTERRQLNADGAFPTFSSDGKTVYFERRRLTMMAVDVDGSNERIVFPKPGGKTKYQVVKPRVSPDEKLVAFTSDRGGRWTAWYGEIATGEWAKIQKGCEPHWFPDMSRLVWIKASGTKQGAGIYEFHRNSEKWNAFEDAGLPLGHEYFPTLSSDGRYLLFSAAGKGEHDHVTSRYQIFVKDLKTGERGESDPG